MGRDTTSLHDDLRVGPCGTVYWITGLPGAGKSTVGRALCRALKKKGGKHVVFLDGDELRAIFDAGEAYTLEERLALAKRYAKLCRFLSAQGVNVICATVSLFHEVHNWNRKEIPGYYEILLDVPMDELKRRDQKGLYSRAEKGKQENVLGMDQEPQFPVAADLVIDNDHGCCLESIVRTIMDMHT